MELLNRAIEEPDPNPDSAYLLGDVYLHGNELVTSEWFYSLPHSAGDATKALQLFKLAGKLGHSEALCNVGAQYFNGVGVERDYEKAFYAYQNAAIYVCIEEFRDLY